MKNNYSIPYSLDSSYMDMEITIQSNNGIGLKPFPIKNILLVLTAIASCSIILTKTFISDGTLLHKVIFIAAWTGLCALLLTIGKTKQIGLEKITSLMAYTQTGARVINTRSVAYADPFLKTVYISKIDERGFIHYLDGSIGVVFDVVGNASVLLFNNHKEQIIDRVDVFYRKMKPGITYHYITNTEAQNVYMQIAGYVKRKEQLTVSDPDLDAMLDTNIMYLKDIIGSSYKSLHQYMIIQGKNAEELNEALATFYSEVDSSELMFKFVEQLDKEEVEVFLKTIYTGSEKHF